MRTNQKKSIAIDISERLKTLLSAACWVITVMWLTMTVMGIRTTMVSGESMQPTLADGDMTLLQTSGYTLEHGSIVVFRCDSHNRLLVKRVIGLPGDTIELCGTNVYRNGERLDEPYIVPGSYTVSTEPQAYHVEAGHVFVLGDNRPVSFDSRYEGVGQVDTDDVLGVCFEWGTPSKAHRTFVGEMIRARERITSAVENSTWISLYNEANNE